MMKDLARIKKTFTDKTEVEYRSRGYEVSRDVALDFYPDFRADLLASRKGETKVIAVQTRTGMAVTSDIVGLSEAIKPMPGWSFELLLVGEPELLNAPPGAESFDAAGIGQGIAEAERALEAGLAGAAFVLAWSACEAAVRILAAAAGVEIQRITQTRYLLSHAVYQDAISERDYERLSEMLAYRNAIVHGFAVKDFDAERTKELIVAAKKLRRAAAAQVTAGLSGADQAMPIAPLDIPNLLRQFRSLRDGWLDEDSKAPPDHGLEWLADTFKLYYPDDIILPYAYPTSDGRIEMEWSLLDHSANCIFHLDTHQAEWRPAHVQSHGDEAPRILNLDEIQEWHWFTGEIRRLAGSAAT